jgi:hypothetical protein
VYFVALNCIAVSTVNSIHPALIMTAVNLKRKGLQIRTGVIFVTCSSSKILISQTVRRDKIALNLLRRS